MDRAKIPSTVVSLALQGGGSHGAFTWGVLDRLLEDERIAFDGISGASAGALNAAVLAHGLTSGGRDGAREALKEFWASVSLKEPLSFMAVAYLHLARSYSPHQLNPFNVNPLREILARQIDFERLRAQSAVKLFIAATEVHTGMPRLFRNEELTVDMLLASSCLPQLHHSVTIDGAAYWDGGLTANPPIRPLVYKCSAHDILVVLLNPARRDKVPSTADEISHRLTEISFSAALFAELQGIALAKQEAEDGVFLAGSLERRLKRLKMHLIDADKLMTELNPLSRLDTHRSFINALFEEGRSTAAAWLETNYEAIGVRSSFTLADHLY